MEDTNLTNWRKASYSSNGGANCIEVANNGSRVIVRDSKDSQGPILRFSADSWKVFADQVKGERSLADLWPIL